MFPLSNSAPESLVTVCGIPSLFVQVIVVFATTVIVDGLNAEFWMKTSFKPGSDTLVQLFKILKTAIRKAMPTDNLITIALFVPLSILILISISGYEILMSPAQNLKLLNTYYGIMALKNDLKSE
jgi:hypothetical protein